LEIDSTRRDFTFNAIYYDLKNEKFIDPQDGIEDLKNKKIRFIGSINDRIEEDALRILRFIRFKNKYNFEV
jgi:tRNA nucleotidyltransferase/poly(A) polymerase